ncbi:MAG: NADH-quinone oxidoreductase subunit A [Kiritimatiellia bacterium]|nr:NADH-quinone oxidoreductase subunit A [Kiritimatiellia bacterium]
MNIESIILAPPLAFAILLIVICLLVMLASRLAARPASVKAGTLKPYACGEDVEDHHAMPEYSQFFPFAFFFTIMHVVALIIATVPVGNLRIFGLALLFIAASVMGLFILYRN